MSEHILDEISKSCKVKEDRKHPSGIPEDYVCSICGKKNQMPFGVGFILERDEKGDNHKFACPECYYDHTPIRDHTPEPWNWHMEDSTMMMFSGLRDEIMYPILNAHRCSACCKACADRFLCGWPSKANADRLCTCVNACTGIYEPEKALPEIKTTLEHLRNFLQKTIMEKEHADKDFNKYNSEENLMLDRIRSAQISLGIR